MKKIKNIVLAFVFASFIFVQSVFALDIKLSANKTNLNTDDYAIVKISVNGNPDNQQLQVSGLDNFNIIGKSSSQNFYMVNGKSTIFQEQTLTLKPIKSGDTEVFAIAYENGKQIKSNKITFNIKKSLLESTREKLLKNSETTNQNEKLSKVKNIENDNPKNLLTSPSQKNSGPIEKSLLKQEGIGKFPSVKHISAFNSLFWIELLTIIFLMLGIVFLIQKIFKPKIKK